MGYSRGGEEDRRWAELVGACADVLPRQDGELMRAVFVEGRSKREMGRLLGVDGRALRRRLEKLVQRVESPKFGFVRAHLSRMGPARRRVAVACVLHGRSLREAAAELGTPLNAVRRHMDALHAMFEAGK